MNIIETLSQHRKGKCLTEAQEAMQELVKKCIATGKKGRLVIQLDVTPNNDTVLIQDDITTKLPRPSKPSTTFYADDDGSLSREDPRQEEFPEVAQMPKTAAS